MDNNDEFLNSFIVELKRGTLTLAVLSQLDTPQYGYSLLEKLVDMQVEIESSTLYPLLRRLEKQGVLTSEWNTTESRPRKYYRLSDFGREIYHSLKKQWKESNEIMEKILREGLK